MNTKQVTGQRLEADATKLRSRTTDSNGNDYLDEHESYSNGAQTVAAQKSSQQTTQLPLGTSTTVPAQSHSTPFLSAAVPATPVEAQPEGQASHEQTDITCVVGDCPNAGEQVRRVYGLKVSLCWTHSRRLTTNGTLDVDQPVKKNHRRPKNITACQVDECDNKPRKSIATDGGRLFVCESHYDHWYRDGSIDIFEQRIVTQSDISNARGSTTSAVPAKRLAKSSGAELTPESITAQNKGISEPITANPEEKPSTDAIPNDGPVTYSDEDELTDDAVRLLYSGLVSEFGVALRLDPSYAALIIAYGKRLNHKKKNGAAFDGLTL